MRKMFLGLVIILLGALMACGTKSKPVEKPIISGALPAETRVTGKESWQAEWEKVVEGARKEGRVVLYTGSGAVPARISYAKILKDRYNIDLEWITGQSAWQAAKIQSERNAGIYHVDLLLGSPSSAMVQTPKSKGQLEPLKPTLILPEVLDDKVWYEGFEARWVGKERLIFGAGLSPNPSVVINTNLVKPEELTSHLDLLNPKWYGKILTNEPTEASASTSIFLMGEYIMGWDFVKQLVKQLRMVPRELATQWVVMGKYPITLRTSGIEEFEKEGAPIAGITFKEGAMVSVGSTALALMNKAPNPNAARVFINFYLSKEGQTIFSHATGRQSTREDVPIDPMLPPTKLRQPGSKYIRGDTEEFISKKEEFREGYAKEMMAELMKN